VPTDSIKRRDLSHHLLAHGCVVVRQDRGWEVWMDPSGERRATVPRGRELPLSTARGVCRALGIREL
jgi:hypothetical protein